MKDTLMRIMYLSICVFMLFTVNDFRKTFDRQDKELDRQEKELKKWRMELESHSNSEENSYIIFDFFPENLNIPTMSDIKMIKGRANYEN